MKPLQPRKQLLPERQAEYVSDLEARDGVLAETWWACALRGWDRFELATAERWRRYDRFPEAGASDVTPSMIARTVRVYAERHGLMIPAAYVAQPGKARR